MSAAKTLSIVPAVAARKPFTRDAALPRQETVHYTDARKSWANARAEWQGAITAEQLLDIVLDHPHELVMDPRDGAFTRGAGGLGYTPHGLSQFIGLMRAGIRNEAQVELAHETDTRSLMWRDVVKYSKRPKDEECIARTFVDPRFPGIRAVRAGVSGRHSLEAFDDANVIAVLDAMDERSRDDNNAPARRFNDAFVVRTWDKTHAHMSMAAVDGASLGFSIVNSETGCSSLAFRGSVRITALDAQLLMPTAITREVAIEIASKAGGSRRRHTLPRVQGDGSELSKEQRNAIAAERIETDIETALAAAAILADRFLLAKLDINPMALQLAEAARTDESAIEVLKDLLLQQGMGIASDPGVTAELARIMVDDTRLQTLPKGSAAFMAGAFAVLAKTGKRSWEAAEELMAMAGKLIMDGWKK